MIQNEKEVQNNIFGLGMLNDNHAQHFTGKSYAKMMVNPQNDIDVYVATVSFEPGCYNNWHIHRNGYQIIMCTAGEGWYQEEGQPAKLLRPGDTVIAHDGVKHWHGATKDSWFAHLVIGKGSTDWLAPVNKSDYDQLGK